MTSRLPLFLEPSRTEAN